MPPTQGAVVGAVAPDTFRKVMGHFVTGITVVTALDGDRPQGITVNALTSVSLEPPLVVVALDRRRFITPTVHRTGRYAVNVLSEDQQTLSDCFAGAPVTPDRDAFCGAPWTPGPTGLPLIDGAIATLECTVTEVFQAGDHELFVARVDALGNAEPHPMPLLYYRRQYLRIQRAETAPLEGVPEHVTGSPRPDDRDGEA
jgi:3-hydroxy-9,10-secoandrosta-1,3,5(10)-triene-9,17-dione monooxygenase reductase component